MNFRTMNTEEFEIQERKHGLVVKWWWAYFNTDDAITRIGAKVAYSHYATGFDFYDDRLSPSAEARGRVVANAVLGNKYAIHALEIVAHYNPKYKPFKRLAKSLKKYHKL